MYLEARLRVKNLPLSFVSVVILSNSCSFSASFHCKVLLICCVSHTFVRKIKLVGVCKVHTIVCSTLQAKV